MAEELIYLMINYLMNLMIESLIHFVLYSSLFVVIAAAGAIFWVAPITPFMSETAN